MYPLRGYLGAIGHATHGWGLGRHGKDVEASEVGKSIALREPHERTARANLSSAKSGLELARTRLARTTITAVRMTYSVMA